MKNQKNSLLWSLKHPKTGQVSYLFGTIHIWDAQVQPIYEKVLPYLQSCELFAAESHLAEMSQVHPHTFYLPEDKRLKDFFEPKKYLKMAKQVKKITKQDIANFEHLTPFVLTSTLSSILMEKGDDSMDEKLWAFAAAENKPLFGIESVEEQLAYYQRIPYEDQAKQLSDILKKIEKYRLQLKNMLARYVKQDIQQLYKNSKKGLKSIRQMMIYDRNKIMAARIADFMEMNTIFVALGAGHLAGQKGILSLLKKQGYKVGKVKM